MTNVAYDVFFDGKWLDRVWYYDYTADEAYRSLVSHDGYDSRITVRKARKTFPPESDCIPANSRLSRKLRGQH